MQFRINGQNKDKVINKIKGSKKPKTERSYKLQKFKTEGKKKIKVNIINYNEHIIIRNGGGGGNSSSSFCGCGGDRGGGLAVVAVSIIIIMIIMALSMVVTPTTIKPQCDSCVVLFQIILAYFNMKGR